MKTLLSAFVLIGLSISGNAQKKTEASNYFLKTGDLPGLKFRMVGPALTSGRISDIAIHPENQDTWYVSAASGGVWKTTNHGTTFQAIFDSYGSYSIGCLAIAPSNPNTIWVGTGENNNQRSVAYGDGVYRSLDGGKSFKNMGLKESEHIGKIIVHPTDENTVWVAAYGPLWSKGGERGVYKTTDGGLTWTKTLEISQNTGISEIAIDPTNPTILYASAHQRRRHEWTYISGGPECGMWKSTDGGSTWREINEGLPKGDMGRIGIAVSPVDPNVVYAIIEGRQKKGGFFRSTNKGESWSKMSDFSTSGNYYQEIICDLSDKNKIFSMDTWLHHSDDGGKSFKMTGEEQKHVDNHCMWIDPKNPDHWILGCDGGLYETFTHAQEWRYYSNLPIIQFYKVATDNATPFYNIYGGTQDNNSMGGPARTINEEGILNSDWFITNGGDGFESAIDPLDPNIVYAQAQYGWLVRYDKNSGERVPIQPLPGRNEAAYRWNWDAPLLISPHDNKTLYFCANRVFKSTNRGDDWQTVSPDLSRQIDRNKLPVMDQIWSMEAVAKNQSTTIYGNIVAFDESRLKQGLLYTGTDDGLIQMSEDGGNSWQKTESFSGVPPNTRVNMIVADVHDEKSVYAVFNNHRSGDFKPYLMKSNDKGKTWKSIAGDLPERGSVYAIRQDYKNPNLLFAGTEFGCYFSINGGTNWVKISGLPTIAVYDIELQERENDLVVATFGRGFYVLDDYSPLRAITKEEFDKTSVLFPVKDALQYVPASPLGNRTMGHDLWSADNPEFGACFNLYIKETVDTKKDARIKKEKELEEKKEPVDYPTFEALWQEEKEDKEQLIFVIKDAKNQEIQRLKREVKKGLNRVYWDLRMARTSPIKLSESKTGRYSSPDVGLMVVPGVYSVEIFHEKDGELEQLVASTNFKVVGLNNQTLLAGNNVELENFRKEVSEFKRSVDGAGRLMSETTDQLNYYEEAIRTYPNAEMGLLDDIDVLKAELKDCGVLLWGDWIKSDLQFETMPGIADRLGRVEYALSANTTGVTKTNREHLAIARDEYKDFRTKLDSCIIRTTAIERKLEETKIPYIKGKDERWQEENE